MVDLGKYALEVGLAYGVSITLLIGIIWVSIAQSRAAKRNLDQAEERWRS